MSLGSNTTIYPGYNSGDGYIQLSFQEPKKKYNVVLILTDDQGYGDIGYRDPSFSTPNIDSLAVSGIRLERMYGQTVCSPARAALLTGLYVNRMDATTVYFTADNRSLSHDFTLLPQYLKEQGYRTVGIGKWHLGMKSIEDYPTRRGFDTYFGHMYSPDYYDYSASGGIDLFENEAPAQEYMKSGIYMTELLGKKSVEYINEHPNDANIPLFLYIAFSAPHTPLQAPDKYAQNCSSVDSESNRKLLCMMITAVDEAVGEVVEALRYKNMLQRTIFIYASDNGGIKDANVGGFNGYKGSFFEGGVRVPSFIGGLPISDGHSAGLMFDGMAHLTDLFATVMHIAGVDNSNYVADGRSLLDGTELNSQFHRSEIHLGYKDYPYDGNGFGVVFESNDKYWKYTYRPNTVEFKKRYNDKLLDDVYLFDLSNDPTESRNLLDVYLELRDVAENSIPNFRDIQSNNTLSKHLSETSPQQHANDKYRRLVAKVLTQGIEMVDEIKAYSRPFQVDNDGFIWQLSKYRPTDKGCWYPHTGPYADTDCYRDVNYKPDEYFKHMYPLKRNTN